MNFSNGADAHLPNDIGAQVLDLWVRATLLAALAKTAPWSVRLADRPDLGEWIAALQAEIVRINDAARMDMACASLAAAELGARLAQLAGILDQRLESSRVQRIGNRSVEKLRARLNGIMGASAPAE